jgi:hypothetical protein
MATLRGDGMTQRQLVTWAKEEILDGIDRKIYRMEYDGAQPLDFDELAEITKQRNRIARLFQMDERKPYDITADHKSYKTD